MAAASSSPIGRSSRLANPRPTQTMRSAASRFTAAPSFGRRSATFTNDGRSSQRRCDDLAGAGGALSGLEGLGHDGEHLHRRVDRLALHGVAAERVAPRDQRAVFERERVDVGHAAGVELLRQTAGELASAAGGAEEHVARFRLLDDLRQRVGDDVDLQTLERRRPRET